MTFQVEDYISHLQQISEDQKTTIQSQKKEIEMIKKDSETISKLITDATLTENSIKVVDQVEYIVTEFKNLKENLEQLKIEKEILSETLSEHSSSFQKEKKITSLLDQYDGIDVALKNKEPVEKVQILMELCQKQTDELSELEEFKKQMRDLFMEEDEVLNRNIINTATKQNVLYKNLQKIVTSVQDHFLQLSLSVSSINGGIKTGDLKNALEGLTKYFEKEENFEDNVKTKQMIEHLQVVEECFKIHLNVITIIDLIYLPHKPSDLSSVEKLEHFMKKMTEQSQEFDKFKKEFSQLACSFNLKENCYIPDFSDFVLDIFSKNNKLKEQISECKQYIINNIDVLNNRHKEDEDLLEIVQDFASIYLELNEKIKIILNDTSLDINILEENEQILDEKIKALCVNLERFKDMKSVLSEISNLIFDENSTNVVHDDGLQSDLPIHLKELIENYKNSEVKQYEMLDKISKEIETFEIPDLEALSVIEKIQAVQVYVTQLQDQQKETSNLLDSLQTENIFQQDPSKEMNFETVMEYFAYVNKKLNDISLLYLSDVNNNNISNHNSLILENIHHALEENQNLKNDYENMQKVISKSNILAETSSQNDFSLENFAVKAIELRKKDEFLQRVINWTSDSSEQRFLSDGLDNEIEGQSKLIDLLNQYQTIQKALIAGGSNLSSTDEYVCLIKRLYEERNILNGVLEKMSQIFENGDFSQNIANISFEKVNEFLTCGLNDFTDLKERNTALQQDIESIQENLFHTKNELEDLKQENSQLRDLTEKMKPELYKQQIEIKNKINECKMLENELQLNRSELQNMKDRYEDLIHNYQVLEKESIQQQQRLTNENNFLLENRVSECTRYENEISTLSNQLVTLEDELRLLRNVHKQVSEKAKYLAQEVRCMKKDKQEKRDDYQKNLDEITSELKGNKKLKIFIQFFLLMCRVIINQYQFTLILV